MSSTTRSAAPPPQRAPQRAPQRCSSHTNLRPRTGGLTACTVAASPPQRRPVESWRRRSVSAPFGLPVNHRREPASSCDAPQMSGETGEMHVRLSPDAWVLPLRVRAITPSSRTSASHHHAVASRGSAPGSPSNSIPSTRDFIVMPACSAISDKQCSSGELKN